MNSATSVDLYKRCQLCECLTKENQIEHGN